MFKLKPKWIDNWAKIYRSGGIKILFKKKGWKVVIAFFSFYLVRDTLFYIIIPWLGYNHFSSCF